MSKGARFLYVAAMAAILLLPSAAEAQPGDALAELNQWRAEVGVPPVVRFRPEWNDACAKHMQYVEATGGSGHYEDPSSPWYTPDGDDAARNSVLAYAPNRGPRIWEPAVYHRMAVLEPRLRESGFATSNAGSCLRVFGGIDETVTTPGLALYPWPANGATGVPVTFEGGEIPSPNDDAPGVPELGYLLSVNINGPWSSNGVASTDVQQATLVADDGRPVVLSISDRESPNAWAIAPGFGLFPREALRRTTTYNATASGVVSAEGVDYPFTTSWRFTTGNGSTGGDEDGSSIDGRCFGLNRLSDLKRTERRLLKMQSRKYRALVRMYRRGARSGWPARQRRAYRPRLRRYRARAKRIATIEQSIRRLQAEVRECPR
jgi:hypothetical protein